MSEGMMNEAIKAQIYIGEILTYIKARIGIAICGMLLGGAVFWIASAWIIKPEYESSISMYVSNTVNAGYSSTINDITASQQLVKTYIALLEDESVYAEISRKLVSEYSQEILEECFKVIEIGGTKFIPPDEIRDCVSMSAENDTEVLKIVVTTSDPVIAAEVCRLLGNIASNIFKVVIQAGDVNDIGVIKMNEEPVSLEPVEMGAVGLAAGAAVSILGILLAYVLDTKIHTVSEFSEKYQVPVLGMIPKY